jgi:hypothetical protein
MPKEILREFFKTGISKIKMLEIIPADIDLFFFHHYSFSLIILQAIKIKNFIKTTAT